MNSFMNLQFKHLKAQLIYLFIHKQKWKDLTEKLWKSDSTKSSGNTQSLEQGQNYSLGILIRYGPKPCI